MDLSIVIPLLNEGLSIPLLHEELHKTLKPITEKYELIFIDDGSTDGSSDLIEILRKQDPHIKLIQFRRNFGKSAALSAGFREASGKVVITMDADLQDDPQEIPHLLDKLRTGDDVVSGWKFPRRDPLSKTFASKIFNKIVSIVTGVKLHDMNCGLKCYRQEVVRELQMYGEMHRFIPVLASWKGFKVGEIKVRHFPRRFGKSKFGFSRFLRGFFDFITVYFITKYLKRPLHFFGGIGMLCFGTGFVINFYFGMQWLLGLPIRLRPLLTFGWILLIVGLQLVLMGLIGEMIAHGDRNRRDLYDIKKRLVD
jgi:glycosyltransferase involved in cell wall biosynthesis